MCKTQRNCIFQKCLQSLTISPVLYDIFHGHNTIILLKHQNFEFPVKGLKAFKLSSKV